jgi:hypothetical protein
LIGNQKHRGPLCCARAAGGIGDLERPPAGDLSNRVAL